MLIDTPTAWSILCTPLCIAAGLGWIRCARMLAAMERRAQAAESDIAFGDILLASAFSERDKCKLRAEQYASSWGRVMRLLRIAEGELKTFRTAQLRQEQAERMDAAADRIAA